MADAPKSVSTSRVILHVDMDAFYASVEQRDRPELRGKPVIVGGAGTRGVVSAASYEARVFGVHSAMPGARAKRLCPQGIFIPVRMGHYQAVSRQIMTLFERLTPWIEPLSVDEAFLDVSGSLGLFPDPARAIKDMVKDELQLTTSVGVATNKFLAKLASDMDKPDGLTRVPTDPQAICDWLAPLPIERMWGVGAKTAEKLHRAGLRSFADLQSRTVPQLARVLGERMAQGLSRLSRGLDDRPVNPSREEKSISNETTFSTDLTDPAEMKRVLKQLAEKVGGRLRAHGRFAATASIKVRFGNFETLTRQVPLRPASHRDLDLIQSAMLLFERVQLRQGVRLLGFGVAQLCDDPAELGNAQLDLFEEPEAAEDDSLDLTVDALRKKFGTNSIRRAGGL